MNPNSELRARHERWTWHAWLAVREGSAGRLPGASLALFVTATVVFLSPMLTRLLQYDRVAVLKGEYWRVLTCQWTHWNASHLVWDALMLLVLGTLCERLCRANFLRCVVASAIAIPIAMALMLPQMPCFRGLSGLDSALFVLLAVQLIRTYWPADRPIAVVSAVALVGFALKTGYECLTGSTIFVQTDSAFTAVPLAHIVGGAMGLFIGIQEDHHDAVHDAGETWVRCPAPQRRKLCKPTA